MLYRPESLLKGVVEAMLKLEDFPLYDYLQEKGVAKGMEIGRTQGAREMVLRVGTKRFGEASEAVQNALAESDFERLQVFVERLAEVESWEELLG